MPPIGNSKDAAALVVDVLLANTKVVDICKLTPPRLRVVRGYQAQDVRTPFVVVRLLSQAREHDARNQCVELRESIQVVAVVPGSVGDIGAFERAEALLNACSEALESFPASTGPMTAVDFVSGFLPRSAVLMEEPPVMGDERPGAAYAMDVEVVFEGFRGKVWGG